MAESFSREKSRQAPQKEGEEILLLCDPGWYVHKPDVQNKWDDNTHTLDTHTHSSTVVIGSTVYKVHTSGWSLR